MYKVFTHDGRSPIQRTDTGWDGKTVPFTLPDVGLATGAAECAAGWNYCEDIATALSIAGFWPDGWPAIVTEVHPSRDAIARGAKRRASVLTIVRVCTMPEIEAAIHSLSQRWFGPLATEMAQEQIAWWQALGRPQRDEAAVEESLGAALQVRGLKGWTLRRYESAGAARDAGDAGAARAAWAARDAGAAWDASHISIVVIGAEEIKNESVMEQFLPIFEAFENGLWCYWFLDDCFLWLPIPKIIKIGNRLHCETGPAFELPEEKLYFLNGVLVPDEIVTLPSEKIKRYKHKWFTLKSSG